MQVQVAAVNSDGSLLAASVKWLQVKNTQSVLGRVIGYSATGVRLLVFPSPSAVAGTAPLQGSIANVTLDSGATFAVDADGFTIPSGFSFSSALNLTWGQQLQVEVDPGSVSCVASNVIPGPPPVCNFTTNSLKLEPSQLSGTIASISSPDFILDYEWSPCAPPGGGAPVCNVIALLQYDVETTSQTTYENFNPDNFSGLADNDLVSVNGWLFEADNGLLDTPVTPPEILADDIRQHPGGTF